MAMTPPSGEPSDRALQPLTARLLDCGLFTPLVFWATTVMCGLVLGDYNHLSRMVSELGASGTPTRFFFTAGLVSCSFLSVLFIIGLSRVCQRMKLNAVPVWLMLTYSISIAGAGLFPLPLRLHGILGLPSIFLVLSPLTAMLLWPKAQSPSHLKVAACVALALMSLGFLAFVPMVLSSFPGLKQRCFHVGWGVWFIYLSLAFIPTAKGKEREHASIHA